MYEYFKERQLGPKNTFVLVDEQKNLVIYSQSSNIENLEGELWVQQYNTKPFLEQLKRFVVPIDRISNIFGFIEKGVFKIRDKNNSRNKGFDLLQSGKQRTIEILNYFVTLFNQHQTRLKQGVKTNIRPVSLYTPENTNNIKQGGICAIVEILLRFFKENTKKTITTDIPFVFLTEEEMSRVRKYIVLIFQPVSTKSKHIFDNLSQNKNHDNIKTSKDRTKRLITETKKWVFTKDELEYDNQLKLLSTFNPSNLKDKIHQIICSQIKTKIRSYKEQDLKKNKYDSCKFVTIEFILYKFKESKMICFYCNEPTKILYEYVREPKQWTVERLNNEFGHNCDNIEIACLSCNLRRRTMHFERYLTTKQICEGIVKIDADVLQENSVLNYE